MSSYLVVSRFPLCCLSPSANVFLHCSVTVPPLLLVSLCQCLLTLLCHGSPFAACLPLPMSSYLVVSRFPLCCLSPSANVFLPCSVTVPPLLLVSLCQCLLTLLCHCSPFAACLPLPMSSYLVVSWFPLCCLSLSANVFLPCCVTVPPLLLVSLCQCLLTLLCHGSPFAACLSLPMSSYLVVSWFPLCCLSLSANVFLPCSVTVPPLLLVSLCQCLLTLLCHCSPFAACLPLPMSSYLVVSWFPLCCLSLSANVFLPCCVTVPPLLLVSLCQ